MKRSAICLLLIAGLTTSLYAQELPVRQVRLSHFLLQSAAVVTADGRTLSTPGMQSDDYWFPVTVPCTVLTGLVKNNIYPDPYNGMNNMLIPDASDSFNHQYHLEQYSHLPNEPNPWKKPYWYRTHFAVPSADAGRRFQLVFKGINYRAEVWINGQRIADSSQMVGMFAEYSFNVSKEILAGADNALAVKIYPLDYPGLPAHPQLDALGDFYDNGGPTGDIGKNVTMLSSVGWDWIPEVRDRNMGIWQPVYLRTTGHAIITHPQVITELPNLPDTSLAKISMHLTLSADAQAAGKGLLKVSIIPENFEGASTGFTYPVNIKISDSNQVSLTADKIPELNIKQPALWWPNGYGKPNLYRVRIQYLRGNDISDDTSFLVGIRTVSSVAQEVKGWERRDFFVNGKKVHLVGGAWVPDMMLNRDSLRLDYELHLCRNANVNLVRIWGGGLGETDDFYELADRYGMMVWQDFWITGDTHGGFKGSADWPLEGHVFVDNVISTIYRIRNHASLLVWTGGNEGHARQSLYEAMRNNVAGLDGTRPFIPCSSGFSKTPKGWKESWPDDKPSGVYSSGPYSWVNENRYFNLVDSGRDWLFKDETGIPSQPPFNSLAKIIPNLVPDKNLPYPLNNTWGYHDACSGNGHYEVYYKAMVSRFGAPTGLKDFSSKMQLLNASGYRAIFEAAGHKLDETGGVMLWKLNAAFPSVIWQIYDWYLEPNAGYYFLQNACEPVHIQLNADDSTVMLVNRTFQPVNDISYSISVYDIDGKTIFQKSGKASAQGGHVQSIASLRQWLASHTGISFVSLQLTIGESTVSRNVYWFSPGNDFTGLPKMPEAALTTTVIRAEKAGADTRWTIRIKNASDKFAFFINPQIWNEKEELMPSFWTANYFSLAGGADITVTVSCPNALLPISPLLKISGLNSPLGTLALSVVK